MKIIQNDFCTCSRNFCRTLHKLMLWKCTILKSEFLILGEFWFHLWLEQGYWNLKCSFLRKRLKSALIGPNWTTTGPSQNWSIGPKIGSELFFNLYETSKFSRRKRHLNFDANDKINVKINSRYRYWFQKRWIHRSLVKKRTKIVYSIVLVRTRFCTKKYPKTQNLWGTNWGKNQKFLFLGII